MSEPDRRAKRPKKKEDAALKTQRPEQESSTAARSAHPLLGLQASVGNRAVQRLVEGDSQPAGESAVIQRHMGPAAEGMGAAVFASLNSVVGSLSSGLGDVGSAMGLVDLMRSMASFEPCPTDADEPQASPAPGRMRTSASPH